MSASMSAVDSNCWDLSVYSPNRYWISSCGRSPATYGPGTLTMSSVPSRTRLSVSGPATPSSGNDVDSMTSLPSVLSSSLSTRKVSTILQNTMARFTQAFWMTMGSPSYTSSVGSVYLARSITLL